MDVLQMRRSTQAPKRFSAISFLIATILAACIFLQFWVLPSFLDSSVASTKLSQHHESVLDAGLRRCAEWSATVANPLVSARANSRWNEISGQNQTLVLRNATLFDGEDWRESAVDITFSHGIITEVSSSTTESAQHYESASVHDLGGKYVTPGLVDMHSHHLTLTWPQYSSTDDTNEVNDAFGPLTPFVHSLDSMKPYDIGTTIIRSGGVTTSLILPGSANIMGGEAFIVKNVLKVGQNGEETVEDMLLEHGVPKSDRQRYLKMACGENPRRVYKHTRMGNAWIFRKHMERATQLLKKQDAWCLDAAVARERNDAELIASLGELPDEFEMDTTLAMLRGKIGINIHCYEPEDFEDMILHSKEFGFRIQAFHHALSAWKVPEMIKGSEQNITIATFSDFGLYKKEAYDANLYAGKILEEHGIPVAYKSDHVDEGTNAKYLLSQAAMAHSFGLSEVKALQSVTSVPATSLQQDHRIGYAKPGFDADLVIWESHPLAVGATPLQVFVDGKATFDPKMVETAIGKPKSSSSEQSRIRPTLRNSSEICAELDGRGAVVITGIRASLAGHIQGDASSENMTISISNGEIICFGPECIDTSGDAPVVHLRNGHVLPGLIAVSETLGMQEITMERSTSDGRISTKVDIMDPKNLVYAKYGVHLDGRAFKRAQIGGVTRAVTMPIKRGGFGGGVSTGIRTSEKFNLLNGGIFQDDVALHLTLGQADKADERLATVSTAVATIRNLLSENQNEENMYGKIANGSLPLVIHVDNKYDISQMIRVKQDFPSINMVIFGGAEAANVAAELAAINISVILTHNRGAPDEFEKKDVFVGPPLSRSQAAVLAEANVTFAIAMLTTEGDSGIHYLPLEARWAAKFAGLPDREAVDLVSTKIEKILGLGSLDKKDIVIWEGNPLEHGATPAVIVDGASGDITGCWPTAE